MIDRIVVVTSPPPGFRDTFSVVSEHPAICITDPYRALSRAAPATPAVGCVIQCHDMIPDDLHDRPLDRAGLVPFNIEHVATLLVVAEQALASPVMGPLVILTRVDTQAVANSIGEFLAERFLVPGVYVSAERNTYVARLCRAGHPSATARISEESHP